MTATDHPPIPEPADPAAGPAAPAGRRQRKKQATRDDLIAHAARLFDAQGFDETTTEQIAEAADVSQRTFFRHFPSKEAVLYADMNDQRARVREALMRRPADEPVLDAVRRAIMSLADGFEDERELRFLQARMAAAYPTVSAYSRAVVQAEWERELIAAIAARLDVDPIEDPRPEIIAGAAMSALRASIRRWTMHDGHEELPDLVGRALDAIAHIPDLAA